MPKPFEKLLLEHIRNGRNDEAKAMLNEELARAFDESNGTLLHHTAYHDNALIARKLIELGADVDRFGGGCTTPLTVAVKNQSDAVVKVLLEANARLDIVDNDGISALQLALDWCSVDSEIFKLFTGKLRTKARTNEELAETLIRAGCNMYHAATLRDVKLMECMLQHGVDVNSKYSTGITALHVAVNLDDMNLADWLLNKGADIDAYDEDGKNALTKSTGRRNLTMLKFLLEHDAPVDVIGPFDVFVLLYTQLIGCNNGTDEFIECAELLFQRATSLPSSKNLLIMFYCALDSSCDKAVKLLIAHLAMFEKLGDPIAKSVMTSAIDRYQAKISKLREYYEPCQQVLTVEVFKKWSLLDLLNESDHKMRLLVRKETFLREVERFSSEKKLSESYSYYYNSMMRRIEKANRVVKLEDEAILVICKIFKANYNQFYDFARGVVEYLNERELERLVQV